MIAMIPPTSRRNDTNKGAATVSNVRMDNVDDDDDGDGGAPFSSPPSSPSSAVATSNANDERRDDEGYICASPPWWAPCSDIRLVKSDRMAMREFFVKVFFLLLFVCLFVLLIENTRTRYCLYVEQQWT